MCGMLVAITPPAQPRPRHSRADSPAPDPTTNPPTTDEVLRKVDRLVQQNEQLEKQNRELMDQIISMRQVLARSARCVEKDAVEADATARALQSAIAAETQPQVINASF